MKQKKIITSLIFLLSVAIPISTLSLFPTPCGYGLCLLLFYYPIIAIISSLSALAYYKYSGKVKIRKAVQLIVIILVDLILLTYFYPKGEYSPLNQIKVARQVSINYDTLKPVDIFKATEDRNFLLITALYHKFQIPNETYSVRYCFIDSIGSCDTIYKQFNYFIKDNKVLTDNSNFNYNLDIKEGTFSFTDTVQQIGFSFKVGYPNFGKYRKNFNNSSSELSDNGERITGLVKDVGQLRIITDQNNPKFEYKFTRLFETYLSLTK